MSKCYLFIIIHNKAGNLFKYFITKTLLLSMMSPPLKPQLTNHLKDHNLGNVQGFAYSKCGDKSTID